VLRPAFPDPIHPFSRTGWIPRRSATPSTALVPQRKSGFPFRTPAFCSVSRGQRRLGEKEYRAPSVTPGVALRPRTQGLPPVRGRKRCVFRSGRAGKRGLPAARTEGCPQGSRCYRILQRTSPPTTTRPWPRPPGAYAADLDTLALRLNARLKGEMDGKGGGMP
jgi:hypothetical protein